jgi:hypothetical protein
MIRLIYEQLSTCSKMNKLVQTKLNQQIESDFFTSRYGLYKNNEIYSCCNNKQETVKHLFIECNYTKIKEFRNSLSYKINKTVKARLGKIHNIPGYFVKTSYMNKQNSIDTSR